MYLIQILPQLREETATSIRHIRVLAYIKNKRINKC